MLEATIVLELLLAKYLDAAVIGALLLFNAIVGELQEARAQRALATLRSQLSVRARVQRDGQWQSIAARDLVPGDLVHMRMGDIVPADVRLSAGAMLLDQSALTGESVPVEGAVGSMAYAGALIRRGEATGEVTATAAATRFGRTAELVAAAHAPGHLHVVIFTIVKYLVAIDVLLVALVLAYAGLTHLPLAEILPFALILLVASVPVALPATFTVATALGALELARNGVLVARLSAIEEAAAMDVLCTDKTGTITQNRLSVAALRAYEPADENALLRLAVAACDESTQDPLDLAILAAARARGTPPVGPRVRFVPFDPATKRAEAVVQEDGGQVRILKGAPHVIQEHSVASPADLDRDLDALAAQGCRVLGVAAGQDAQLRVLGVRVLMATGDAAPTARAVARQVGLGDRTAPAGALTAQGAPLDYDVFAEVLPEEKYRLVRGLQDHGHTVGMTGDGVNDAPALKQAEVGIAVDSAMDVAKAAAGLVLTRPGLSDALAAVETSRRIYQRMLTYTLNKIIKTLEISLLLSLGLILTGTFLTTPSLIVLLLFTNDFVTMAIATDRVSFSRAPDRWRIGALALTALPLAVLILLMSFGLFLAGRALLGLSPAQLHTLIFLVLVFGGQGTVYLVRERGPLWASRPSRWLLLSSIMDVLIVSVLAVGGILMAPLPWWVVLLTLCIVAIYLLGVDFLKVALIRGTLSDIRSRTV
jgi:H+-transporting ATPase